MVFSLFTIITMAGSINVRDLLILEGIILDKYFHTHLKTGLINTFINPFSC